MLLQKKKEKKEKKKRRRNLKKILCGVHNNGRENGKNLHPNILIFYYKKPNSCPPESRFV
jgi:hypothetical protein